MLMPSNGEVPRPSKTLLGDFCIANSLDICNEEGTITWRCTKKKESPAIVVTNPKGRKRKKKKKATGDTMGESSIDLTLTSPGLTYSVTEWRALFNTKSDHATQEVHIIVQGKPEEYRYEVNSFKVRKEIGNKRFHIPKKLTQRGIDTLVHSFATCVSDINKKNSKKKLVNRITTKGAADGVILRE